MTLGVKIKLGRMEKGYTQKELSARASILQKNLSNYENDLTMPGADTLKKIAQALGVTTDYLLGGSQIPELNNPDFVKILNEIDKLPKKEKDALLTMIQTFLNAYKKSKNTK